MNKGLILTALLFWLASAGHAAPAPGGAAADLAGNWGGAVEIGKAKFRLVIKIKKGEDGKITGAIDVPDQGASGVPISAILFNSPAVRWEIDPFDGMAFNGKIASDGSKIEGAFDKGPGGRPMAVTFLRLAGSGEEPKFEFASKPGAPADMSGFWLASIGPSPENRSRVGLQIGRAADGTFEATMDLLDQGALGLKSSLATWTNAMANLNWQVGQTAFEGKLEQDGQRLTGTWKQRGQAQPVTFERRQKPATVMPDNVSFTPDPGVPGDIRGQWQGVLVVPNQKLRIVLDVGKTPDGTITGTLTSPDQGSGQIPMTAGSVTNLLVKMEWKSIRGTFKGTLNSEGTVMDGAWEQGGALPLKLERSQAAKH